MGKLNSKSGHISASGVVIAVAIVAAFVWGIELGLEVVPGWVVIAIPGLRRRRDGAS